MLRYSKDPKDSDTSITAAGTHRICLPMNTSESISDWWHRGTRYHSFHLHLGGILYVVRTRLTVTRKGTDLVAPHARGITLPRISCPLDQRTWHESRWCSPQPSLLHIHAWSTSWSHLVSLLMVKTFWRTNRSYIMWLCFMLMYSIFS